MCFKHQTTLVLIVPVAEDTLRRRSECFSGLRVCSDAFFPPHFRSHFYSFGVHLEIRGFKRCYFHPAPSKMNIWLKDKTQGVENQSVNCTISSQPALSCSHQVSWLVGFTAKKEARRGASVSCGDTLWNGRELNKIFSSKWPLAWTSISTDPSRYDWVICSYCLYVSSLLICCLPFLPTWLDGSGDWA